MSAAVQSFVPWSHSAGSAKAVHPLLWGVGIALAIAMHLAGLFFALSSGAGLSLLPEGGGGRGGMTVMMGAGNSGLDAKTQVAKGNKTVAPPALAPKVAPPKAVPPKVVSPKPVPPKRTKVVSKPKPKPKPNSRAKVKPKPAPKQRQTVASQSAPAQQLASSPMEASMQGTSQAAVKGAVSGQGQLNTLAGGAPVGASVGAGSSKGFGLDTAMKAYRRQIHRLLLRTKRYPKTAQRLGQQGVVRVKFVLAPDGRLLDVTLLKRSRYPSLNREAQALVRRIGKFPPLPREIASAPHPFRFNIPFKLY